MFFRIKPSGERRYLQIVENTRDGAARANASLPPLVASRTSRPLANSMPCSAPVRGSAKLRC